MKHSPSHAHPHQTSLHVQYLCSVNYMKQELLSIARDWDDEYGSGILLFYQQQIQTARTSVAQPTRMEAGIPVFPTIHCNMFGGSGAFPSSIQPLCHLQLLASVPTVIPTPDTWLPIPVLASTIHFCSILYQVWIVTTALPQPHLSFLSPPTCSPESPYTHLPNLTPHSLNRYCLNYTPSPPCSISP